MSFNAWSTDGAAAHAWQGGITTATAKIHTTFLENNRIMLDSFLKGILFFCAKRHRPIRSTASLPCFGAAKGGT